jgi:hypothetical protein
MTYRSTLSPNECIIDDNTDVFELFDPVIDGVQMRRGYTPRDWDQDGLFSFADELSLPLIPRSEWAGRVEAMEQGNSRLSDMVKAAGMETKNQQSTNYCWIFAATSALQAARIFQGYPHLELSPASVGCLVTNYRNVGGWSTQGIREGAKSGWAPSSMWPDTAIRRSYDTEEVKAARQRYKLQEWWELRPRSEEEVATCLLCGIPVAVGFNWWGHAVLALDLVSFGNEFGIRCLNSWGPGYGEEGFFVLKGSKRIADDAVAPRAAA